MKRTGFYSTRYNFCLPLLIFSVVALITAGCDLFADPTPAVEETPKTEYSIADLAEMANPSIAYIEAWEEGYADYYFIGSGFVITNDGKIVTNYHVLDGADAAGVEINGRYYDQVTVLAASEEWDLAILQVEATNLKPLMLAGSIDQARLGEQVVAMGNPEGLKKTVSDGIISTLYRRLDGFDYDHVQTTAPISKGSSGGPLLNLQGEVIGVNTLTYMTGQNLNFAVPVDLVLALIGEIGPPASVAEVFSYSYTAAGQQNQSGSRTYYKPQSEEFAVILSWEGSADLELEIWSDEFDYLGSAHTLGDGPDITSGGQGEEWFVFGDSIRQSDSPQTDFSGGRYIVSAYYYGPEPVGDDAGVVDVEIAVSFPDGSRETALRDVISYYQPYDQWFAILVDTDARDYKILDLYMDAPLAAILEWDTEINLDLMIWDLNLEEPFYPDQFWYGYDFTDGRQGLESFRFAEVEDLEGRQYDFTGSLLDIYVFPEDLIYDGTTATVTLIADDYSVASYEHSFTSDQRGDYFWIVAFEIDPEAPENFTPADIRFYLDD